MKIGVLSSVLILLAAGLARPAYAADPTVSECLIASNTSVKLLSDHKLLEARAQLLVCVAASCPSEIRQECSRRIDRLTTAIPTIIFEAKDAAGNDVSAVSVTLDGRPLTDRLDGTAIAIDPGEHTFRFSIAGQPPVDKTLVIREADKDRHERIVVRARVAPAEPPAVAPAPATGVSPPAPPARQGDGATDDRGTSTKTLGLVVGGVGAAGLVVASVFGLQAFSNWSNARAACESSTSCVNHAQAESDKADASTAATISTIGFLAGGLALATGAALFLLAPTKRSTGSAEPRVGFAPSVGPAGAGMLVKGAF